ncbi:hypothetical protein PRIPAC_74168 [Pristionchus pacificus]|uniref:Uncharacterized protein n=1 Tax=Pristionchus pacificus TaxID=54126 RepID=A0A2A6C131_PRIPA|nr:hypothetical protein PRIPAC_74168 [Pristionchus pacificus]|eukprot:PDM71962.1 hypothetical protein PRIPAC_38369 [Pristionchus pacificus]
MGILRYAPGRISIDFISFTCTRERSGVVVYGALPFHSTRVRFPAVTPLSAPPRRPKYLIYWHGMNLETIIILYAVESFTLIIREVLTFSLAILPSIILSVVMHTLSLVPVLLWVHEIISYPTDAFLYFLVPNDVKWNIVINRYLQAHSLNCILTKLTLIWSHRAMQNQFLMLFTPARCSGRVTPEPCFVPNKEEDTRLHFSIIDASWS